MAPNTKVSLDAMAADVYKWRETAGAVQEAHDLVNGFQLHGSELSFIAKTSDVTDAYEDVRAKTTGLLGEGAVHLGGMADKLETVMRRYEETEKEHIRRIEELARETEGELT